MAQILCAYSGIQFSCEHFPAYLSSRETYHPVFNIPQKKLLSYTGKWAAGELTPTDSYLLFLGILHSTDLIDFRTAAFRTNLTDSIVAQNMECLVKTVIKLNTVSNPHVLFPSYVISQETRNLHNVHHWLKNWKDCYQDFLDGYKSAHESSKLIVREKALERLIKNPHKPISSYSRQIAEWAALAGNFPVFLIKSPFTGLQTTCADYWKIIIDKCATEISIHSVPSADLKELIEHCEDHIPIGSGIYSHALFKLLRAANEKQKNFLGLGDIDIKSSWGFVEETDTVEIANMKALIASAPDHAPRLEEYPNKLAYLKAKLRWDMSQKFKPTDSETEGE